MTIKVERLMREIEDDVRRARRRRLLARGGAADYRDPQIYEQVDIVLRRALEGRDHDALLLPDLLSSDPDWKLTTHLRFSSHRPVIGPFLIFMKRRVLLPLTRWLYEYSLENFRRQQRLNMVLLACVEELAIENARLRHDLAGHAGQVGHVGQRAEGRGQATREWQEGLEGQEGREGPAFAPGGATAGQQEERSK